jgi:hypothetical protein
MVRAPSSSMEHASYGASHLPDMKFIHVGKEEGRIVVVDDEGLVVTVPPKEEEETRDHFRGQ